MATFNQGLFDSKDRCSTDKNNNLVDISCSDTPSVGITDALVVSDQHDALNKLASEPEFVKALLAQKTMQEMQNLFLGRGVTLSYEEIDAFLEVVKSSLRKEKLDDDSLDKVPGGVFDSPAIFHLANKVATGLNDLPEDKVPKQSLLLL